MSDLNAPVLILGIGNILMGDEGVGVHVIRELEKRPLPPAVALLDGGTGGFHLLGDMQKARVMVLIDASDDQSPPGTIRRLSPKFSSDYPTTLTAHDIGLKDLLDAFYLTGDGPEVILYAVTIKPLTGDLTLELSEEIQAVVPELADRILDEARKAGESFLSSRVG